MFFIMFKGLDLTRGAARAPPTADVHFVCLKVWCSSPDFVRLLTCDSSIFVRFRVSRASLLIFVLFFSSCVSALLVYLRVCPVYLVEALLLQPPPQSASDPRQSRHRFVSHWLADEVPMLLRRGRHPAGTQEQAVSMGTGPEDLLAGPTVFQKQLLILLVINRLPSDCLE